MPPKGKGDIVGKNVLTTPTEVEVPLETTPGRTVRKALLRRNSREWPFFVFKEKLSKVALQVYINLFLKLPVIGMRL
jgi:hypothetical protein